MKLNRQMANIALLLRNNPIKQEGWSSNLYEIYGSNKQLTNKATIPCVDYVTN